MSNTTVEDGLSLDERIELETAQGYRQEVDCFLDDIRKKLESHPDWCLSAGEVAEYQTAFDFWAAGGVPTARCAVDQSPEALLRKLRLARLPMETTVRRLKAKEASATQQETSAPNGPQQPKPTRTQNVAEAKISTGIRECRKASADTVSICKCLDDRKVGLPNRKSWSLCPSWCDALQKHKGAVTTYISRQK
jgi:hypothetical protein